MKYLNKIRREKITQFGEWQLCPKCLGNGYIHDALGTMSTSPIKQCDVCNGAMVLVKPIIKQ